MIQYPHIPELLDPYQVKPQDSHDRKFIEYFYTLQKTSVSNNEALFQKIINGMGDLESWHESFKSGNPAHIVKKFLEQYTPQKDYLPALFLYPRIIKVHKLNAIDMQVCMMMAFEKGFMDTLQQVNALRELNYPSIVEFFRQKVKVHRRIDLQYEDFPGNLLTRGDYNRIPNISWLSSEWALISRANAIMKKCELPLNVFAEFRKDLIYIACDEHKLIKKVCSGLYLPCDEAGIILHEEIIFVYRVLADAFENFVRNMSKKQKKLNALLQQFDEENPIEIKRKQKRVRINALIGFVEKIISQNKDNEILIKLSPLIDAIRILMTELDREFDKIAEKEIINKVKALSNSIIANGKKYNYVSISPEGIFDLSVFKDPEYTARHSRTVIKKLKDHPDFCYVDADAESDGSITFAYLPLLYRMEAEVKHKNNKIKIGWVEKLIANLGESSPNITSYRRLQKEHNEKLYTEAVRLMASMDREDQIKKKEAADQKKSFDRVVSISVGMLGVTAACGLYAMLGKFTLIYAVLISLPTFLVSYGLSAIIINTIRMNRRNSGKDSSVQTAPDKTKGKNTAVHINNDVKNDLERLFPSNQENVMANVYTPKKLLNSIKSLERIKNIQDDEKKRDAIKEFQMPLMQYAATIKIPESKIPINYSNCILIGIAQMKSPAVRKKIGAYFKNEIEKNRKHGGFNEKTIEYYQHIANEIEFNFARYLN